MLEQIDDTSQVSEELKRQWGSKTPDEQVQAGRKALYGVLGPALASGEALDVDSIAQVEAIFESIFQSVEKQSSKSPSRTRQAAST